MHMDNDFLYDNYGSSPGSIPAIHNLSGARAETPGEVVAYTAKRAQNANSPLGNHDIIKSFTCTIIAIYPH